LFQTTFHFLWEHFSWEKNKIHIIINNRPLK
jgi:hypothetical protein